MLKRFIMLVVGLVFFIAMFTVIHENTHKEIDKKYGCYDTEIHYSIFSESYTTSSCNTVITNMDSYNLAQSNVESFGYQISAIGIPIISLLLYLILFKGDD